MVSVQPVSKHHLSTLAVGGRAVGRIWKGDGAPSTGRTNCSDLDIPVEMLCRVMELEWKPLGSPVRLAMGKAHWHLDRPLAIISALLGRTLKKKNGNSLLVKPFPF